MIYILDNDPKLCAQYLDDKLLNKMIKGIAGVLCRVHHELVDYDDYIVDNYKAPPLDIRVVNEYILKWAQWARECKANYLYLTNLGLELNLEYIERFFKPHKFNNILHWLRDNVPDLPEKDLITPFPLVMPKKYQVIEYVKDEYVESDHVIESYRNYYQAKLKQKPCDKHDACIYAKQKRCLKIEPEWTNRNKPEWLEV
jgi:hypothetical protein